MLITDRHLLSFIFEHAPIGMAIVLPSGEFNLVNTSLCNILGYSQAELNQLTLFTLTHPDDFEASFDIKTKLKKGEVSNFQIEKRYIHKSGKIVWAILSVAEKKDPNGHVEFYITQLVDITEQKEKELELKRMKTIQELITENSKDTLMCCTPEGIIEYISPSGVIESGYEISELLGTYCFDNCHPEDNHDWLKQDDLDCGKNTVRIRHKEGYYGWFEGSFKKIRNDAGEVEHIIIITRDITERKQNEELVIKSEKLSVIGELAAGIAHEIRNPLTSLRGFIQMFLSEDTLGRNRQKYEIMLTEINRINEIVSELLALAKPSKEQYGPQSISDMMNEVITLLEAQANLLNVEFEKEIQTDLPLVVCNHSLKQVFINLLKNVMESMPTGGRIITRVNQKNDNICIEVKDQGYGIPSNILGKIGEPFYTTKETGTGLGLTISQRIISNHKGTLQIDSQVGEGTTVEILLPIDKSVQSKL